ncbi:hypothetical protein PGTUg99_007034 [Puccinia graminis f. sp. tritici]|uniref:DUF6589 domain-containing protein n=1 Tax=Puccinia graminis f. sp. tritici TaxID=56615 RepID=A0A5B0PTB0_PUCGR|nr:hypothetical protein PGTUg99_007034 [Puccinia graminis f. sp. tritici]
MPFLYNLIKDRMMASLPVLEIDNGVDGTVPQDVISVRASMDTSDPNNPDEFSEDELEFGDIKSLESVQKKSRLEKRQDQIHAVASRVCSIIQFVANQRVNGLQLLNSVVFLACGLSERMNSYLHFLGLTSSRKTAQVALTSLSRHAEKCIIQKSSLSSNHLFAPIICIDNVDFQETIHSKSTEKQSRMFHGTWGYLHSIKPAFLANINPDDPTLRSYREAISQSANMVIRPSMLIQSKDENLQFELVLKCQIDQVMLDYMVIDSDKRSCITRHPSPIEPILAEVPDITMLKLMIASDNSAEGISEVFEGIIQQTDLKKDEFFDRLQVVEGDLGTCMYIESLCALRKPSSYAQESLANVLPILGAAHVMWNIAQAIFLAHFGDNHDSEDLCAWHTLSALGIPSERPTVKNDFNLMIGGYGMRTSYWRREDQNERSGYTGHH